MSKKSNSVKSESVIKPPASSLNESIEDKVDMMLKFRKEVSTFTEKVIDLSESLEYPNHFTGHILCLIPYLVLRADDENDFIKAAIWGASLARIFTRSHPHNMNRDGTIRRKNR